MRQQPDIGAIIKLAAIEVMARDLITRHAPDGWTFRWNNARVTAGVCKYGPRVIELSRPLALLWDADHDVRDTILHEIAHAIAGCKAGHGQQWRAACRQVGAKPQRCYPADMPALPARWEGTCPAGHKRYKSRRSPGAAPSSCRQCSPRFDRRYLITWRDTRADD